MHFQRALLRISRSGVHEVMDAPTNCVGSQPPAASTPRGALRYFRAEVQGAIRTKAAIARHPGQAIDRPP